MIKKHDGPLACLIHEAVQIARESSMNSKSEWGGYKLTQVGGRTNRERKIKANSEENITNSEVSALATLKVNIENYTNPLSSFRNKRKQMANNNSFSTKKAKKILALIWVLPSMVELARVENLGPRLRLKAFN